MQIFNKNVNDCNDCLFACRNANVMYCNYLQRKIKVFKPHVEYTDFIYKDCPFSKEMSNDEIITFFKELGFEQQGKGTGIFVKKINGTFYEFSSFENGFKYEAYEVENKPFAVSFFYTKIKPNLDAIVKMLINNL